MDRTIALAALVIGIIAIIPAFIALGIAIKANKKAEEANSSASTQVDLARHDVSWTWQWVKPGVMGFVNESRVHTALNANLDVRLDDARVILKVTSVAPGKSISVDFGDDVRRIYEQDKGDLAQVEDRPLSTEFDRTFAADPAGAARAHAREVERAHVETIRHRLQWRIDWQTSLGTPKREKGSALISLINNPRT
jgi:hypothetical protein